MYIIKDLDWQQPLVEKRCTGVKELHKLVQECAELVRVYVTDGQID